MCQPFLLAQFTAHPFTQVAQCSLHQCRIPGVPTEGGLPADGFGDGGRLHSTVIDATGVVADKFAVSAEVPLQHLCGQCRQLADGADAQIFQNLLTFFTDAGQPVYR
ncbi:hypothetical protein ES703_15754 [subsurface metagenome]